MTYADPYAENDARLASATEGERVTVRDLNGAATRAALEEQFGAEPLEQIHHKLALTEDEWARGWSRFGPGNVSERRIKSLICLAALEEREKAREAGEKVTESLVEQRANAHARVVAAIDEVERARAAWAALDEQRQRLIERVMRGQGLLRVTAGRV